MVSAINAATQPNTTNPGTTSSTSASTVKDGRVYQAKKTSQSEIANSLGFLFLALATVASFTASSSLLFTAAVGTTPFLGLGLLFAGCVCFAALMATSKHPGF